jgi:hypothetical protein
MRTFTLIAILLAATVVRADLISSYSVTSYDPKVRRRFDFEVTREQLLKAPLWGVDQETPPLSPRRAERLAITKFHQLVYDTKGWELKRISLEDMGDGIHWIYIVDYKAPTQDLGGSLIGGGEFLVVVLMDGTVIEPKVLHMEPEILQHPN